MVSTKSHSSAQPLSQSTLRCKNVDVYNFNFSEKWNIGWRIIACYKPSKWKFNYAGEGLFHYVVWLKPLLGININTKLQRTKLKFIQNAFTTNTTDALFSKITRCMPRRHEITTYLPSFYGYRSLQFGCFNTNFSL